jgi:hypothetical protein
VKPGDRIVMRAKTKRIAPAARRGEIVEVLDPGQPRLLVRWDDGRTTVIAPLGDSVVVEPAGKAGRSRSSQPKWPPAPKRQAAATRKASGAAKRPATRKKT